MFTRCQASRQAPDGRLDPEEREVRTRSDGLRAILPKRGQSLGDEVHTRTRNSSSQT